MRRYVLAAVFASALMGLVMTGCDLLDKQVLVDDGVKVTVNDSTTIRVMGSMPDSTKLVINATSDWHADVAREGDWCSLSKTEGGAGTDTIVIHVAENPETEMRRTSIVVETATMIMVFRVAQAAAEMWHDKPYWHRTAAQRIGLHGMVERMTVSDNLHSTESDVYTFDKRGNLLTHQCLDKIASRYDTTWTYTYDEANHRLTCSVKDDESGTEVRSWSYEYGNTGRLVAVSAQGWMDQDPLGEYMDGMIVPDLSAIHGVIHQGGSDITIHQTYTFDDDTRLVIVTDYMVLGSRRRLVDTTRVSYQYFNNCQMLLPYTSRGFVTNCGYYANGILKMLRTADEAYDFLDNPERVAVVSYSFSGPEERSKGISSYECEYNTHHDLKERLTRYTTTTEVKREKFPEYQYDEQHNWTARMEETVRPGLDATIQNATKREIIYYK
jgi:hypothetical protein